MSFKIIVPHQFTEAELGNSNIVAEPAWASATAYAVGDIVSHTRPENVSNQFANGDFECVATIDGITDPQSSTPPAESEGFWVYLGPENRHRAFDVQVGVGQDRVIDTVSSKDGAIVFGANISTPIQAAAYINVTGTHGQVRSAGETDDGSGGAIPTTVTDVSFDLIDRSGTAGSFFNWLMRPIIRQKNKILFDLNINANTNFFVDLINSGSTASAGAIVFGRTHDIGTTALDAGWRLNSRSFKSFDGLTNSLVRRLPGNSVTCEVKIPEGEEEYVRLLLEQIDGTAAVFVPLEDRPDLSVYGVLTNVQTTAKTKEHTFLSITVERL